MKFSKQTGCGPHKFHSQFYPAFVIKQLWTVGLNFKKMFFYIPENPDMLQCQEEQRKAVQPIS